MTAPANNDAVWKPWRLTSNPAGQPTVIFTSPLRWWSKGPNLP